MKKVLFATTATAALAIGGMASAQGVALFGDARLGLGYNINNDGSTVAPDADGNLPDDFRAISRVRFGVNMTGETDSGLTFGATIRADNAVGGQGGALGQTAGSVFVSGSLGTLTFGDTNGADEQWVGDVPGDYSLTGLGDGDETLYVSNGGGFGNDDTQDFANDPTARPTIRYDFDIAGFGVSISSNRDLNAVGVGAGYSADWGGGSWSIGAGYYDWQEFEITTGAGSSQLCGVPGAAAGDPIDLFQGQCTDAQIDAWRKYRPGSVPDRHFQRSGGSPVVGRRQGDLRQLRLRRDLRPDRRRPGHHDRADPRRRLLRLGRLGGRCLLRQHPERRRQRQHQPTSTATRPSPSRVSTTSAAVPASTAASAAPTTKTSSATSVSRWRSDPHRDGERGRRASARLFFLRRAQPARYPRLPHLTGARMPLADIRARIAAAVAAAGRPADAVTLVAVSKVQPAERVRAVLAEGQRIFGENRVQEAEGRWPPFQAEFPGVELHLVGPLQSNKLARALDLFQAIHSLDRDRLARRLADAVQARGACPTLFVEVNVGREPQKAGIYPDALDAFVATCRDSYQPPGLRPDGDPARRRGPGPALRRTGRHGGAKRASRPLHGHERRLRAGDRRRGDACPHRLVDLRRTRGRGRLGRVSIKLRASAMRHNRSSDGARCNVRGCRSWF